MLPFVAVVEGRPEGVLPLEALFCLPGLLFMQGPGSAVAVQLSQGAGLQRKGKTAAWVCCDEQQHGHVQLVALHQSKP